MIKLHQYTHTAIPMAGETVPIWINPSYVISFYPFPISSGSTDPKNQFVGTMIIMTNGKILVDQSPSIVENLLSSWQSRS